jgi:uncharacterized protein YprB with RNaseH-like and TPR domain
MIRNTFQLVPGVGPWREKDLWARGILTWDDFPGSEPAIGISRRMDARVRLRIEESKVALRDRDLKRLAELIPPREHWRLYAEFQREAAFFDIETEGGSLLQPTVASVFDREGLHVFIRGRNLDQFPEVLAASRLWVTFNGSCFDIPALKAHFDSFPKPPAHLDLRFLCNRVGLSGGLKQIEDRLGFGRPPHLKGVDGWDAVILWRIYGRDLDLEALRFLVEYNLYDSFQLKTLVEKVYNRAVDRLGCEVPRVSVFDRGDVLYDLSKLLLGLGPSEHEPGLRARLRSERRALV